MDAQETVDRFAELAAPRLAAMLRLKDARHVYEPSPGALHSSATVDGVEFTFDRGKSATQPYRNLARFIVAERVMHFVIEPGLLPLATAMSKDVLGRRLLATRRIANKSTDHGVVAHVEGFGVRVMMHFDEASADTIVTWDCLYSVAR